MGLSTQTAENFQANLRSKSTVMLGLTYDALPRKDVWYSVSRVASFFHKRIIG